MNKKELYSAIGFIKISKTRQKILKCLENNYMLPSANCTKNRFRNSYKLSNALSDLKKQKIS